MSLNNSNDKYKNLLNPEINKEYVYEIYQFNIALSYLFPNALSVNKDMHDLLFKIYNETKTTIDYNGLKHKYKYDITKYNEYVDNLLKLFITFIDIDKEKWTVKETKRIRIPTPFGNQSYCEKNWVPVLDKPYHFIKWTAPTEIVKADPNESKCEQVAIKKTFPVSNDQRGGSQIVKYGNIYLSVSHEVFLFNNYLKQKDGIYRHRLCVWDDDMNLVGISPEPFSFLDGRIEFCAGAAVINKDLLISFGFQDNAAFILKTPKIVIEELIVEALDYGI
mgnify:CR=1 FL=1